MPRWPENYQPSRGRGCYVRNKCDHPECAQANRDYQRKYMRTWYQRHREEVLARKRAKQVGRFAWDPMREWLE